MTSKIVGPVWEQVNNFDYYEQVAGNMISPNDDTTVRFGTTGDGTRPNYQVTKSNGETVAYSGLNHKEDKKTDIYNDHRISEKAYSRSEVRQLYIKNKK